MDQRTLRGIESQVGGRAHGNFANEGQVRRQGLAGAKGVRRADGIPVHGGAREFGERVRGQDIVCGYAAEGEERVEGLCSRSTRREMREQEEAGFVGREESQEFGHESVGS